MFKSGRHLLIFGAVVAAPAAAQLLGGQPLGGVGQVIGGVGQVIGGVGQTVGDVGQTVGQTVGGIGQTVGQTVNGTIGTTIGRVGQSTGSLLTAPGGTLIPQPYVQQAVAAGGGLTSVQSPIGQVTTDSQVLLQLRHMRHQELLLTFRGNLEPGDGGVPIARGRLLLTNPTSAQVDAAARAGFEALKIDQDAGLGLTIVTVSVPRGTAAREALKLLTDKVPGIPADVDPLFEPAGGTLAPMAGTALAGASSAVSATSARRIVMIDGGVAAHPSMARASIEQKGFAGRAEATGHGTAVASLLVGDQGRFRGAARGTTLYVADIYGGSPAAGSASTIVQALSWAASKKPEVVTISLVGPPNVAIERAIGALSQLGIKVVAAAGNDGPAAPAAFPASYQDVVAVTGVDARGRALPEAGRPRHLDFAAPGASMAAALPGKGYADVRGTSFATPLVAARMAATGSLDRLASEAVPGKGRVGRGIVCSSCRIAPSVVGAK